VAAAYGWSVGEPRFDWQTLLANKDREIARLNGVYEGALARAGVKIVRARARVLDARGNPIVGARLRTGRQFVAPLPDRHAHD